MFSNMFSDYEVQIRELEIDGEYELQEKTAKEFLNILYQYKYDYPELTKEYLGFAHYSLARAMYKTKPRNFYKYIIENIEKSLQYTEGIISEQVSKSCWLLAVTYRKVYGDLKNERVIYLYNRALIYFRKSNKKRMVADLLNNIAYINKDLKCIRESITIYEELLKQNDVELDVVEGAYETAYISYLHNGLNSFAKHYYNKITNEELKNKINEKYEITA